MDHLVTAGELLLLLSVLSTLSLLVAWCVPARWLFRRRVRQLAAPPPREAVVAISIGRVRVRELTVAQAADLSALRAAGADEATLHAALICLATPILDGPTLRNLPYRDFVLLRGAALNLLYPAPPKKWRSPWRRRTATAAR